MAKSYKQRFFSRFRQNGVLYHLLDLTGNELRGKKWVFILGCYNSGTTLLEEILSKHPQVSSKHDEGVMLTNQLARPEDFGWRRMWCKCEEKMEMPDSEASAKVIKRHWSHFYNSGAPYLVEKSISNTPRASFFEKYFKPAYFIHIVRNGYAVVEGISRKAKIQPSNPLFARTKRYPIESCALQWKRSLQVIDKQRPDLSHFLELSYEELTENPDAAMNRITAFLGVDNFPRTLTDTPFLIHQNSAVIKNMNMESMSRLTYEEKITINETADEYLKKYGYYNSFE